MPLSPTSDAAGRNKPRQPLAGRKRGRERLEIAIVDADELRFQAKRPLQLLLIMDFHERVHAERQGRLLRAPRRRRHRPRP